MLAIRKASVRIKFQPFPSVTFHALNAKSETSSSSYTYKYNTGFNEQPPTHISDTSITLKRSYSQIYPFIGKHGFSSQAGTKSSGEEDDEVEHVSDGELISSGFFNAVINSSPNSDKEAVDKWVEEGRDLTRKEILIAMTESQWRRMYRKVFELSELVGAQGKVETEERDYASRVDLIAKEWGLQNAENYIEKKIPKSFRGNSVYEALLFNCVVNTDTTKAEHVFNKIKKLKLPITTFACNQMLILYKRTDRSKMDDVLLLMEKENIKPSLLTYTVLVDVKSESGDVVGMEEILEKMKGEGLEPDLKFQAELAEHYVKLGVVEKAKAVLKEMEGGDHNLKENRGACSYLLPIYASLGSLDDVQRVWEVCEPNPQLQECMSAIDAFRILKKIKEAQAVFAQMKKKYKLSAEHYMPICRVYLLNGMISEAMEFMGSKRVVVESGL